MWGMHEENKRKQFEFFVKYIAVGVSAVWLVWAGTDFLDKRNKYLSVDSTPTADTNLRVEFNNAAKVIDGKEYCLLAGQYTAENTGKLTFHIDTVSFELYRFLDVEYPNWEDGKVAAFSLSLQLNNKDPIEGSIHTINVNENFGVGNILQRSFGYVVPHEKDNDENYYNYVVVARAQGGLPEKRGGWLDSVFQNVSFFFFGDYPTNFGEQDLTHISDLNPICDNEV